ncbi:hypothetical protein C7271_06325 [filamentous cyanobacterium CCP5]|nr:hypothetical protein C7271_06325 [filamentous cyanobacterium CCP5]
MVKFEAEQSIKFWVENQSIALHHYLKQPQRLVKALVDANQVEVLAPDQFRLKMRPMRFLMLSIQPVVDLRVWSGELGRVFLKSTGCQIRGCDYIGQRFALHLDGFLESESHGAQTQLQGTAFLQVDVDIPSALALTPRPVIEMAGNSLLKGVLQTMKQRLCWRLISDYQKWCTDMPTAPALSVEPLSN